MSAFGLRVVAIITMTVDHIGLFLLGNNLVCRIVGRIAFPIYAFLIANGYRHTKDLKRYTIRLAVLALVSQVPFLLVHRILEPHFWGLNIFFTLLLGLFAIWSFDRAKKNPVMLVFAVVLMILGELVRVDYGWRGVALILACHVFFERKALLFLTVGLILISPNIGLTKGIDIGFLGLFAMLFIGIYNGKPGAKVWQSWFYWYYPVHLLILYLIVALKVLA